MSEQTPKIRAAFICTIPSAVVTQALAQAGADTVVIDQEHGAIGPENPCSDFPRRRWRFSVRTTSLHL